ncbi:MAG: 23S rRNA (adenine(2503)-C(2))-methyltransferase RlmN, partial [Thermotogae bacterium]
MNILDLSYDELIRYLVKKKIERYRADQVLDWVYKKGVYHFND